MKNRFFYSIVYLLLSGVLNAFAQGEVWTKEKARFWQMSQPWYCGVNYIPSNAVNYTAMWDKSSYSPDLIDKELDLMEDLGMNCVRVVLQYAVYEDDPSYFLKTFDDFLKICDRHGVKVMPCFFDDCAFGVNTDPKVGVQSEPLEGWYAWAWSPSPGASMVVDERTHFRLEKYVKDVLSRHKDDARIFVWDLYNEPTNTGMPERSMPLLRKVFAWAREINPSQPVTTGIWNDNKELNDFLVANSDIITFHCYNTKENTRVMMEKCKAYGRPVICTEWMNRVAKSYVMDILPMFKEAGVGNLLWGLANGKTQTHLPWGHRPENLPYNGEWQHDLYKNDMTPYRQDEINLIRHLNKEYQNPVVDYSLPDPTVIKADDGYFYLYATEDIRNVPILRSRNLVDWVQVGTAFTDETRPDFEPKGGIWAPDINKIDDRYVMYYSMSEWGGEWTCGIGCAIADSPSGPFEDKGMLFRSNEINVKNSIDPFYIEEKGKKYLFWGSFRGIYCIELSADGLSVKEHQQPKRIAGTAYEGTYIHKKGDYYYLFASIGSCCAGVNSTYTLVVGRSKNLFSPYYDRFGNSMSDNKHETVIHKNEAFVGTGHNSEIVSDEEGNDWIFYHAVDVKEPEDRKLMLDRVEWKNGWPVVNNAQPSLNAARPVFHY